MSDIKNFSDLLSSEEVNFLMSLFSVDKKKDFEGKKEPICPEFGKGQRRLNQEEIDKLIKSIFSATINRLSDSLSDEDSAEEEEKSSDSAFDTSSILMALAVPESDYSEVARNLSQLFSVGRRIDYKGIAVHIWFRNSVYVPSERDVDELQKNLPMNHNFVYAGDFQGRNSISSASFRNRSDFRNCHESVDSSILDLFYLVPSIQVTDVIKDALKDTEKEGDVLVNVTID